MGKIKKHYPLQYTGNIIIFILCFIIFFPLALVLALKNLRVLKGKKYQSLSYHGSYGWLIFWTIIFFPIAIILLLINGVDVVEWNV
jgi:predicted CDP-diglyceride synthetase/phosphatidate cytidylyltransferase